MFDTYLPIIVDDKTIINNYNPGRQVQDFSQNINKHAGVLDLLSVKILYCIKHKRRNDKSI